MTKKQIIDAYCKIRTIDTSISDDVLDFMKDCAIEKLLGEENKQKNLTKNESKELADKIWNETIGKEELMHCDITEPKVHPKNVLCDAMGCVKYDEKIHKQ